jgi:fibronectin type 3 domain-containing protein
MKRPAKLIVLGCALVFVLGEVPCLAAGRGNSGEHHVTLSWHPPANAKAEKVVGYNVYRSTKAGGPYEIQASRVPTSTYVDKNVKSGKTYYYVITSVDESGRESKQSEEIRTTVP